MLSDIIVGKIDILLISETKLDNTFPFAYFRIPGFSNPFRRNKSSHDGGIQLYIREHKPSTLLSGVSLPTNVECLFVEVKFRQIN